MVGHRGLEVDFLAFDPAHNSRVHVESTVSVKPFGRLRPWGAAKYSKLPLDERPVVQQSLPPPQKAES